MEEPLRGVDETTYRVERDVVENERRLRSENGYPSEIFARLKRALYGASYFGKPVGGSAASLSSLTLADAVEFARDHYRPERMTLVVAGGAGRDGEALARAFGEIRREGSSAGQANRALPGRATGGGLTPVAEGHPRPARRRIRGVVRRLRARGARRSALTTRTIPPSRSTRLPRWKV